MGRLGYLLAFTTPLLVVRGYEWGGFWNFYGVMIPFGAIPLLDAVLGSSRKNPSPAQAARLERSSWHRGLTFAWVPAQLALLVWGASVVGSGELHGLALVGFVVSTGVATGGVGITLAHELGHRNNLLEQSLAKVLLSTVCYLHFFVEHNRGHHVNVGTPKDPATARFGESLYAFLPRSVVGQYQSAWHLEAKRLKKRGLPALHPRNHMLWGLAIPAVLAATLGVAFGPSALLFFFGQSAVAVLLLEAVNYLEHYGLERREVAPGRFEKVEPIHSWNSSHILSNWFLFHLQRHSDHHAHAGRRYQILRHFEEAPQLPMGYPGMLLLALVPPLWRRVMDPRVLAQRERLAAAA